MNTPRTRISRVFLLTVALASTGSLLRAAATPDTRLFDAISRQDRAAVRTLIKELDVNGALGDGLTPLAWAAHRGDAETVDLLLAARANPNAADDHGVTPLALACENADATVVERLLAAGAKADAAQSNGVTPLMIASRTGNVAIVKSLLARSANVNASTGKAKQTALMWAVSEGRDEVVQLLLDAKADVHATSATGFSPLLFAARNGDIKIARQLLASGAGVNEPGGDGTHALPLAIVSGHDEFAQFLLEKSANPNGSMFGVSALHAAAGSVEMWLREWLRVRGIDGVFGSGVMGLSRPSRVTIVKALLERGADPNARIEQSTGVQGWLTIKRGAFEPFSIGTGDLKGATPLWVAAFSANRSGVDPEVLTALLAGGAQHSLTTADGTTPLMAAAGLGQGTFSPGKPRGDRSMGAEAAVRILVEAGAGVNAVNEAKFTALHGAAFRGLNEVIEYLVQKGANIDAQDFTGRTPFRIAEGSKQSFQFQEWPETAELLKKIGANVSLGISGRDQLRQEERDAEKKASGAQSFPPAVN